MLSSSMLKEEVDIILELLIQGKKDDAKQRLNHLVPQVSSEYGKGAILALCGIINVLESKNVDRMSDADKIVRTAERIPKLHTMDDMDKGYLQTVAKWAKKGGSVKPEPVKGSDSESPQ